MTKPKALGIFVSVFLVCVTGAAAGWPLAGPLVVAGGLIAFSFRAVDPVRQLGLATCVGLWGAAVETGLIQAGIYLPTGLLAGSVICPLWVIAIWVTLGIIAPAFAPPEWRGYIPLAVGGALIAPLVYLAADTFPFGAIHLKRPLWPSLILLALLWQGLWPGICWLTQSRWYRVRGKNNEESPS